MKIFRLMTGSLFLLMTSLSFPASGGGEGGVVFGPNLIPIACGCDKQDEEDLKSRISEANAVIQEYDSMIRNQTRQGKDRKYTQDGYEFVQNSASAALLKAKHPNATKYGGKRGVAGTEEDCESWVRPDVKACLAVVLSAHEEVHSKACKEADKPFNPFVSWRSNQRLIETMEEEKRGYQKELQRLNEELNKMPVFCALDRSTKWLLRKLERDKLREQLAWEQLGMIEYTTMF